jgi:hypothetical protein
MLCSVFALRRQLVHIFLRSFSSWCSGNSGNRLLNTFLLLLFLWQLKDLFLVGSKIYIQLSPVSCA